MEQTVYLGSTTTDVVVYVQSIDSSGTHSALSVDTTQTKLVFADGTQSSVVPTVTALSGTGKAKITFASVTNSGNLAAGDTCAVLVHGTAGGVTFSPYLIPVFIDSAGGGGGGGLTEADVRNAVGLSSANLDTQLSTIDSVVDAVLIDTGTDIPASIAALNNFDPASDTVTVGTNNDKSGYTISGTKQTLDSLNDVAATDIVSAGAITTLNGAVANVDLVDVTTTNTDMRGTDNALTTASLPANFSSLGINASGHIDRVTLVDVTTTNTDQRGTDNALLAASAPSNFGSLGINGAGDVSRVTLVDTVTSNTDMRGTDGANTVAPDNAGIAANGTAINNLNNIDSTDVENAVWNAPTASHVQAGTFGKLMDILKKANRAIDAEVAGTPTASAFDTNLAGYTDGAFDHELLVFTSGALIGEARPILSYASTNGRITFEEALTGVPAATDEFVILPYHTTPTSEIQDGLARTTDLATVTKTGVQYTATAQSGDTIQVTLS